jgi:hypothetical protein
MRPNPYDRRDYCDGVADHFAVRRWLEHQANYRLGGSLMGIADVAINGSYLAYLYIVLLQISVLYLQRPNLNRHLREKDRTPSASPDFYSVATGFIATGLNWLSWLLSAYVAQEFGIANGVLFFILGMGSSIIANIFIPRLPRVDQVGHIISIPTTILLVRAVLQAVGIQTGI